MMTWSAALLTSAVAAPDHEVVARIPARSFWAFRQRSLQAARHGRYSRPIGQPIGYRIASDLAQLAGVVGLAAGEQQGDACFAKECGVIEPRPQSIKAPGQIVQRIDHHRRPRRRQIFPDDPGFCPPLITAFSRCCWLKANA